MATRWIIKINIISLFLVQTYNTYSQNIEYLNWYEPTEMKSPTDEMWGHLVWSCPSVLRQFQQ